MNGLHQPYSLSHVALGILTGTVDIEVNLSHRQLILYEGRLTKKQMACYAAVDNWNIMEPIHGHQTLNLASLDILMLSISLDTKCILIIYAPGNLKIT